MKSVEEARKRWHRCLKQLPTVQELKQALERDGQNNPCESGLRSACWKAFLFGQDFDKTWSTRISDSREAYTALRYHFLKYIEHPEELPSTADPLADDDQSPWQMLREDEAIRAEIFQDVERCMQENCYFREPFTKTKMLNVLFIFTKLNPDLGYRQGMHELLAPILWVVEDDSIDQNTLDRSVLTPNDEVLRQTLDANYIEHDSFTLFCAIMQTVRSLYEHGDKKRTVDQSHVSPIVARSEYIHQALLARVDPELADYLHSVEILPQIFITRWLRLLFGREFPFQQVLSIWDQLLAENLRLSLLDNICVAMLLKIRWQLLNAEYTRALSLLLRYPSPEPQHPRTFVDDAIYLERNLTCEGGAEIIFKYSGKMPAFIRQGMQGPRQRTAWSSPRYRRNFPTRDLISRLPGSEPSGFISSTLNQRLDSVFQDVSQSIHRRTETWGVAKAVKEAVGEARRNIYNLQSTSNSSVPNNMSKSLESLPSNSNRETIPDLAAKVTTLEDRNKQLALMLSEALSLFDRQDGQIESQKWGMNYSEQAIQKVRFVKDHLVDSAMDLPETATQVIKQKASNDGWTRFKQPASSEESIHPASQSPELNHRINFGGQNSHTPPVVVTDDQKSSVTSVQAPLARASSRAPIAESSFSWMLGDKQHSPVLASPVSENDAQDLSGVLFGDGPEKSSPNELHG